MQEIYGAPRVFGVYGTITFSGLTGATWEIIDWNGSPSGNITDAVSAGLIASRAVTERKRTVSVSVLVKGSATLADALGGHSLPELMTEMTVAGADLPAYATASPAKWNLESMSQPLAVGAYAKIDLTLSQVWNGSAYVSLAKVSA